MMGPRLTLVTLGVEDIGRARRFYETLGWKASSVSEDTIVVFRNSGSALALHSRKSLAEDSKVADEPTGFAGMTLACNFESKEEVDRFFHRALNAGAKALKTPTDVFWGGYSGYFADPDGHLWEVAWNPLWPLDEQGLLRLPE